MKMQSKDTKGEDLWAQSCTKLQQACLYSFRKDQPYEQLDFECLGARTVMQSILSLWYFGIIALAS